MINCHILKHLLLCNFEIHESVLEVLSGQLFLLLQCLKFFLISHFLSLVFFLHLQELSRMQFFHLFALLDLKADRVLFFLLLLIELSVQLLLFKSQFIGQPLNLALLGVAQALDPVFRVPLALNQLLFRQLDLFQELSLKLALDQHFLNVRHIFQEALRSVRNCHYRQ